MQQRTIQLITSSLLVALVLINSPWHAFAQEVTNYLYLPILSSGVAEPEVSAAATEVTKDEIASTGTITGEDEGFKSIDGEEDPEENSPVIRAAHAEGDALVLTIAWSNDELPGQALIDVTRPSGKIIETIFTPTPGEQNVAILGALAQEEKSGEATSTHYNVDLYNEQTGNTLAYTGLIVGENGDFKLVPYLEEPCTQTREVHWDDKNNTDKGTNQIDIIYLYGGDDIARGGQCDDIIYGGDGNDEPIRGNRGNDILIGGDGDDLLRGNGGDDCIEGNAGEDKLWGGRGNDELFADGLKDILNGGKGYDICYGGDFDNHIDCEESHEVGDGCFPPEPDDGFDCLDIKEIPPIECEALLALYISTTGPGWTSENDGDIGNDWWKTTTPCSTWHGVRCYNSSQPKRVRQLSLSGNQLNGSIPPELGNLSNLTFLYLHNNMLHGSIPSTLGDLNALRLLALNANQLTGPIPTQFGGLNNLEYLFLHFNQLDGVIPPELGNLTDLKRLEINVNQLTGPIPPELSNLENLQSLYLHENQLEGNIPEEFGGNPSDPDDNGLEALERLTVARNPLMSGELPMSLTNLKNLSRFQFFLTDLCAPQSMLPWLNNEVVSWSGDTC